MERIARKDPSVALVNPTLKTPDNSLFHLLYSSTSIVQRVEISRVQCLEISRFCTLEISRRCTIEFDE